MSKTRFSWCGYFSHFLERIPSNVFFVVSLITDTAGRRCGDSETLKTFSSCKHLGAQYDSIHRVASENQVWCFFRHGAAFSGLEETHVPGDVHCQYCHPEKLSVRVQVSNPSYDELIPTMQTIL